MTRCPARLTGVAHYWVFDLSAGVAVAHSDTRGSVLDVLGRLLGQKGMVLTAPLACFGCPAIDPIRVNTLWSGALNRTDVRYNMYMREEDVMRVTDIGMVPLGYGRFVRADDIVAVLPIEEGRGRGRRTHVHVAGLAVPIVASRSEGAILADMKAANGACRRGAGSVERRSPRAEQAVSAAPHRRSRLGFVARRA
jgi:hypothetical protein